MSKVLVAYVTGTGCTEGVARKIGETLSGQGMQVDVRPCEEKPDVSAYDAVVAGSGVRAGAWHPHAKKWVAANADALKSRPVAFFTVSIAMAADPVKNAEEVRGYTDKMIEKTGVRPLDLGVFAGWYVPEKFSFIERKIMEVQKAPVGDHRDWAAIDSWAASVGARMQESGRVLEHAGSSSERDGAR